MSVFAEKINKTIEYVPNVEDRCNLHTLAEVYRLCSQSEGKSKATIFIVVSAVRYLRAFLHANGLSTAINQIGIEQLRFFSLHLQSCRKFESHPYTKPQAGHLSGHTINDYMRALRAFWSWAQAEGYIYENPFVTLKIPKA